MKTTREQTRQQALLARGASQAASEELLRYTENAFDLQRSEYLRSVPPNEDFVDAWRGYSDEAARAGNIVPLAKYLVQLRFPVQAGMSRNPDYVAAASAGADTGGMAIATGLPWRAPDRCRVFIHATMAGEIPVIIAEEREDFVSLVRALSRTNEPSEIPPSMGACMIAGYRNWHRLAHERPILYGAVERLDRFILLSSGDYSAVSADSLGLPAEEWTRLSVRIRLEHESVHYATKRLLGSMKNSLFDELLADSFALFAATGEVDPAWLLLFLGLENYPAVRSGGRLQNYRGRPPLSEEAFAVLAALVAAAVEQISGIFAALRASLATRNERVALLYSLAGLTLEELASEGAAKEVLSQFNAITATPAAHCGEPLRPHRIGHCESEARL